MRVYKKYFLFFIVLFFFSCEKDPVAPVNKGNNVSLGITIDASLITSSEATVRFIVNELNGNKPIEQGVCYDTSPKPQISANRVTLSLSANTQICTLSGLLPGRQYYARSFVKTANGTFYSSDQPFITNLSNNGLTAASAAQSALQIKQSFPNSPDGVYFINLPVVGVRKVYCIMNSAVDGGGWMLMLKARADTRTFNYSSPYWTTKNILNDGDLTLNDGDAKYDVMNYFPSVDMLALWPDIPWNYNGSTGGSINLSSSFKIWSWEQRNFYNNGVRIAPVDFWNIASNYFISDANNFTGKGSAFSSQTDVRFYGYNYNRFPGGRVRWGFAWNENGGGLYPNGIDNSNDVSGGIGMDQNFLNYSAGDFINCCHNYAGINRSARVMIFVR